MYMSTLFHEPNLKLFPTLSSSNLKGYRPISSKPHFPRPFALKRNASSNLLRKTANMFELVKVSSFKGENDGDEAVQTLEQEAFVDGSTANRIESTLNRLVSNSQITQSTG